MRMETCPVGHLKKDAFVARANGPQILFEAYSFLNLVRYGNEQRMRQHWVFFSFFLFYVGGISAEEVLVGSASWACKPCTFCWHMAMTLLMKHVLQWHEKLVTNIYLAKPSHMHCVDQTEKSCNHNNYQISQVQPKHPSMQNCWTVVLLLQWFAHKARARLQCLKISLPVGMSLQCAMRCLSSQSVNFLMAYASRRLDNEIWLQIVYWCNRTVIASEIWSSIFCWQSLSHSSADGLTALLAL